MSEEATNIEFSVAAEGLHVATCAVMPGLLVVAPTRDEVEARLPAAIEQLRAALADASPPRPA